TVDTGENVWSIEHERRIRIERLLRRQRKAKRDKAGDPKSALKHGRIESRKRTNASKILHLNHSTSKPLNGCAILSFSFDVKTVQEPVCKRPNRQSGDTDESESGEQCIAGCEKLCRVRMERIDRPHAAQDHGGVEKRIDPV